MVGYWEEAWNTIMDEQRKTEATLIGIFLELRTQGAFHRKNPHVNPMKALFWGEWYAIGFLGHSDDFHYIVLEDEDKEIDVDGAEKAGKVDRKKVNERGDDFEFDSIYEEDSGAGDPGRQYSERCREQDYRWN